MDIKDNAIFAVKSGMVVAVGVFIGACLGDLLATVASNAIEHEMSEKEMEDMLS